MSTAGAIIAPWPAILGVLLLVVDLGRPLRFWEMILRRGEGFLMFNPGSVMSWGVWFLTIFIILALIYLVVSILSWPFAWGAAAKKIIGVIGLPFALLVTVYTGVLISATTNTLWNNPVLPIVFVISALVTGTASIILLLSFLKLFQKGTPADPSVPKLENLMSVMILFQLMATIVFIVAGLGSEAMKGIIGSVYGPTWWILVVGLGLILPFILGIKPQVRKPQLSLIVAFLVLLGGFLLRYIILIGGQTI